jgi:hypothetical protein
MLATIQFRIFGLLLCYLKSQIHNIQNYDFACCFVKVLNLVYHFKGII